jgi:hypothetical protein
MNTNITVNEMTTVHELEQILRSSGVVEESRRIVAGEYKVDFYDGNHHWIGRGVAAQLHIAYARALEDMNERRARKERRSA